MAYPRSDRMVFVERSKKDGAKCHGGLSAGHAPRRSGAKNLLLYSELTLALGNIVRKIGENNR